MTLLRLSNAPIGLESGKPISTSNGPTPWVRPSDWITFTEPSPTEQKVIGTVAVFNQESNYLSVFITTTDSSQYTVDWGDGTSTNHNSGTQANKNYVWSDISSATLTSGGYRQAVVTITPTTAGRTFNVLELSRQPAALTVNTNITSPWLDIAASAPNANQIIFASSGGSTTNRVPPRLVQNINLVSYNGSLQNLCQNMSSLQNFNIKTTAATVSPAFMFQNCTSLTIAPPLPPFSSSAANVFDGCSALQYVPLYNTASVTTMQNMFLGCTSLESVPLFNTASVQNFSNTFNGCSSLKTIPNFNFFAAQDFISTFSGCSSLESFPAINTNTTINSVRNCDSMFTNCFSLKSVGLFNITGSGCTANNMFLGCRSLESLPAFNLSTVTQAANFVNGCLSLTSVPDFNFTVLNTANGFFQNTRSLREVPEINLIAINSAANNNLVLGNATLSSAQANLGRAKLSNNKFTQTFQNCQMGATQLNEMYTSLATLNPSITNISGSGTIVTVTVGTANIRPFVIGRTVTITGVDPVAYNITGTVASVNNAAGTFTITNAATGTYVSGGIASITSDRTITVTGNPGVATDDPTIATNKGWTVTG